jgi:putative DNA primase/helicase
MDEEGRDSKAGGEEVRRLFASARPIQGERSGLIEAAKGDGVEKEPATLPITCVGHSGTGTFYYLNAGGGRQSLSAQQHNEANLVSLCLGRTKDLWQLFPKRNQAGQVVGFHVPRLREFLMRECSAQGVVDLAEVIREVGVWWGPENGLIVHCGDQLSHRREWVKAGGRIGSHFYVCKPPVARPADDAARASEGQELLLFLDSWVWLSPLSTRLWLGWVAAAMICGILDWRPHLLITGEFGTGKTTLDAFAKQLLGSAALSVSAPTAASIRQLLSGGARGVLIDELETENQQRAREVIDLARLASSDSQAAVTRGGKDGQPSVWPVRACFYFTSILHAVLRPQDFSRICKLELGRLPVGVGQDGELSQRAVKGTILEYKRAGFGRRLFRRVVDAAEDGRVFENIAALEDAVTRFGSSARVADQLATLLAMSHIVTSDGVISALEADDLVRSFGVPAMTGEDEEGDSLLCVNHILTSSIVVDHDNRAISEVAQDAYRCVRWGGNCLTSAPMEQISGIV